MPTGCNPMFDFLDIFLGRYEMAIENAAHNRHFNSVTNWESGNLPPKLLETKTPAAVFKASTATTSNAK